MSNPQGVSEMVRKVRGRPGGRFRVTPVHRLVLVTGAEEDRKKIFVAGQLIERPQVLDPYAVPAEVEIGPFKPGDLYSGPLDAEKGEYRISQRGGGVVERRFSRRAESLLTR